ncbi:unnamed protein product [Rotaria sordida]|uniref:RING-type domain-containing protein n=1 Tax=Rotaria sordida TaxID=392033 RepID=A0A819WV65_9BILA|nr:unnamed protein product [Rotaria sordida]CAF1097854.1 unnamed protein product [Rotaria sordida]CAF1169482.1 unnamed protein product [Rotaria sordida]CAF1359760.1 unnamed protein product [Rotaria sordida]CAF4095986.1 unnamed protein product [Rotaria sordida]
MTSQQKILSSDRILNIPKVDIDNLECSICRGLLWKPVACQSCETPFCSSCIHQWLIDHPKQCPNRCETYIERKCPPFIAKLLAQLNMNCFYRSYGCSQVTSYEGLDKHEIECSFQPRQCSGCKSQILKKDYDNHMNTCPLIDLICQTCKLIFKRADFNQKHTEIICLKEQNRLLQNESKEYKREIHELNLQLDEMRIIDPSIWEIKITFDDLQDGTDNCYCIPVQYRGFTWISDKNWSETKKHTVTLLFGKPQFILLHWENINKITFESSGGTAHFGSGSGLGSHVILTQMTIDSLE